MRNACVGTTKGLQEGNKQQNLGNYLQTILMSSSFPEDTGKPEIMPCLDTKQVSTENITFDVKSLTP